MLNDVEVDHRPMYKIPGRREPGLFHLALETGVVSAAVVKQRQEQTLPSIESVAAPSILYSYEVLSSSVPEGVDPSRKELYLEDRSFDEVFNMSRRDFLLLPLWRQQMKKKQLKLF
jgi:hypothetical protein